jgi:hypothetical protein
MTNPTEAEIKELKEEVLNSTSKSDEKDTKIIYDGRQYSIRFPKKFIDEAQVNVQEDFFKVKLHIPEFTSKEKPKLTAELIRGKDEEAKTKV